MTTAATAHDKANIALHALGLGYHERIPLDALWDAVTEAGWQMGPEERERLDSWRLSQDEGRVTIPCWHVDTNRLLAADALVRLTGDAKPAPILKRTFVFYWYKMPSSRYEIVAYVS